MASNYISLFGAVSKEGKPIDFLNTPLKEDMPAQDLVWVIKTKVLNIQNQLVDAFQLMFNNPGGLTYSDVYLYTKPGFTTIQEFYNGLGISGTTAPFTLYTNILSRDYKAWNAANQDILINDSYVVPGGRRYFPQNNSTYVNVKVNTYLSKTIWQVSGDQTFAGSYTYFYS